MAFPGPDNSGQFLNLAHWLAYRWNQTPFCQNLIPADEDETVNRFFMYGLNGVTDDELDQLNWYCVLDDLTNSQAGFVQFGEWPHRLRVYGLEMPAVQNARDFWLANLGPSVSTQIGGTCSTKKMRITGRRQWEVSKGMLCAQVTVAPFIRG